MTNFIHISECKDKRPASLKDAPFNPDDWYHMNIKVASQQMYDEGLGFQYEYGGQYSSGTCFFIPRADLLEMNPTTGLYYYEEKGMEYSILVSEDGEVYEQ